jgi:hypothetical protein
MSTVLQSDRKALRTFLWGMQVGLAFMFFVSGLAKVFLPLDELSRHVAWTLEYPGAFVRFVGAAEVAGALGLILPAGTRIKAGVTPFAAACLALLMVYASVLHVARAELEAVPLTVVLFGLCLVVMIGRAKLAPIGSRPLRGPKWEESPYALPELRAAA